MVVVIPCHKEPDITRALNALKACRMPCKVCVLVIVNESEEADAEVRLMNQQTLRTLENFKGKPDLLYSYQVLPDKKAGVGLARKIGMDEAVRWFEKRQCDGIIVCFDADCHCQPNYLEAIYHFYADGNYEAGIVHYEHDLTQNTDAILHYELYLRYYVNALRWAGFPYAYQTLGSCITVKSRRYQKAGGMNTRKAGEDFYFLHKVIPNGRFGEINNTTIHPSARISDRVPFGTGHAIGKYHQQSLTEYLTYHPRIFEMLKILIDHCEAFYRGELPALDPDTHRFLEAHDFTFYLKEMKRHARDYPMFRKRFFSWLDGFRVLKFVHYMRDEKLPNVPISEALEWLSHIIPDFEARKPKAEMLWFMRNHDRSVEAAKDTLK